MGLAVILSISSTREACDSVATDRTAGYARGQQRLRMFASVRTIFEVTNKEGVVKIRRSIYSAAALCLLLTISGITLGQGNVPEKLKDAADESAKAAETFKGVSISTDGSDMRNVYGENVSAKEVLRDNKVTAPAAVRAFPDALDRYSPGKAGR